MPSKKCSAMQTDGRTERYAKNKGLIVVAFLPELTPAVTRSMYIAADRCSQKHTVPVMFSVLLYSTFTVQIL
jgi:hypothetical protein